VTLVGWKQFFRITSGDFKSYFDKGQKWGDLNPFEVTVGGTKYYGAGLVGLPAEGQATGGFSPKIAHVPGANTRISVKFMLYADANTPIGCAARMYIVFYTNGDTAKDDQGKDALGFEIVITQSPSTNTTEFHEFRVEQSGNRVVWYVDGQKLNETVLNGTLQSFVFYVMLIRYKVASEATSSAEQTAQTPTPGDAYGVIIYEITAEYYDWLEDVFSTMTQVMVVMMFAMVGVTLITTLIRAFRVRE
jgi:hypothetical protein